MEAIEVLIVTRAIESTAIVLCTPLLLYLGYRLFARALEDNGQARADLRANYRFQLASFLPGSACILLALVIGFVVFSQPSALSKAEQDLLVKLDQIEHPVQQSTAPAQPPVTGGKGRSAPKPS